MGREKSLRLEGCGLCTHVPIGNLRITVQQNAYTLMEQCHVQVTRGGGR